MVLLTLPYTLKITGCAGEGVICAGEMLLEALSRLGFHGAAYREFPSSIEGGYCAVTIQISDKLSYLPVNNIDCLFVRYIAAVEKEIGHCRRGAVLIYDDSSQCSEDELLALLKKLKRSDIQLIAISLIESGNDPGSKKFYSSEILGVVGRFLSIPLSNLEYTVRNRFQYKNLSTLQRNCDMVSRGYQIQQGSHYSKLPLQDKKPFEYEILDGNEAVARAAVSVGCGFFSSYPITPSTGIGNFLARVLPARGAVSCQAEDEIAAIGAAIGASFAGVKSMTATSGPGLSLMQEFLGYASMVELPLVVVDVQRPGPSTGSPAQFAQEDLFAAVFGSHGETSRIVLAPDSIGNCFNLTIDAFNCSEYFQCPVIILSDSVLGLTKGIIPVPERQDVRIINRSVVSGECKETYGESTAGVSECKDIRGELNGEEFKRYSLETAVAPIPVPGYSSVSCRITGLEHDEYGNPTDSAEMRTLQQKRRMNKLNLIETMFPSLVEWDYCTDEIDFGLIAWGITVAAAGSVVERLRSDGFRIAALYPRLLFPVCLNAIKRLQSMTDHIIVVESNGHGQYARLLKMYADVKPHSILSQTGSPILSDTLYDSCVRIVKGCFENEML
ncbi:MAG: 2-oxoacid:acceptor oxidoreductase family protein [Chitinispirillaceae bacterium]|nr:2-oxoacid:acceptor oxidoreductase family protein [Chitinispirillaceae bacterium]